VLFLHLDWVNTFLPLVVLNFVADAFFIFLLTQFFRTIPAS
jgi:multiple sugar transport system permease protein